MVLQSAILNPLNMSRTSVSKPSNDSWGIIPDGDNGWAMELGDEGPCVSSTLDEGKVD